MNDEDVGRADVAYWPFNARRLNAMIVSGMRAIQMAWTTQCHLSRPCGEWLVPA
ncbi:hypothetical protein [Paraburkholderia pallida]|uniref:hypothetical protein n=1 Tax=Paraburkholderia pallida TaxID=2547399 RepID=UPI001430A285|nr:hypothetical protein [Paraburkholderia pallida]